MYKLKASNQLKKTFSDVKHILKMMTTDYAVVAELTKQNNIHYHAMAVFKDGNTQTMAGCFIEILREKPKFGMCKVNDEQITEDLNVLRSINYLFKDIEKNDKIVNFKGYGKNPTELELADFSGLHQGVNKIISGLKKAQVSIRSMCLDAGVVGESDEEPTPPLSDFDINNPEFRAWELPTEELREQYHNYINLKLTKGLI